MSETPDEREWQERVRPAFAVIDAILKGTLLPEPSVHEQEVLGLADFDPELRYRVARDTLEQFYGKPKQQVHVEGGLAPLTLKFPDFVPTADLIDGEIVETPQLEAGPAKKEGTRP